MLQIVTKMYFREGVPLYETAQRQVLYTNRLFLRRQVVELPVGELLPSNDSQAISSVTASATEYLEAKDRHGEDSVLVATSGTELIDDLADVLSFGLNATFSRDVDLVRRLVPGSLDQARRNSAAALFRGTFDPALFVTDEELDQLRAFMSSLLALRRDKYEAAMKAIRRVVRAGRRAIDDPTLAYTEMVAALESLSRDGTVVAPSWEQVDGRKRKLIDAAVADLESDQAERVRQAVIEAERAGLKNRFVQFVLASISPAFFRVEAIDAIRPIRGADLTRAIKLAYDLRSRNVHQLWDLPPEAYELGDRADTVTPPDLGVMLSLEGMARLARHVIRDFVASAPTGIDPDFDWHTRIPGVLQMQLAPQYWIHHGGGFGSKSADRYLVGFAEHVLELHAGNKDGVTNIDQVLERIEKLAAGTTDVSARTTMVAIYALWHYLLAPEHHRAGAEAFLAKHGPLLEKPSMPAFVAALLSGQLPELSSDEWAELAEARRAERATGKTRSFPVVVEAALQIAAAQSLVDDERVDEALRFADYAIEELPGKQDVIEWEAQLQAGDAASFDLEALIFAEREQATEKADD